MKLGAIDQGTTSTRCLVIDPSGKRQVVKAIEHAQSYPQSGWVEHDPDELYRNIQRCLEAAGPLDAFGIDNQGESCLAWDANTKEALSPIIVWQDERTSEQIAKLKRDGAEELTLSRSGLPLDAYFSASKLGWIIANLPDTRSALSKGTLRLGTTDAFFVDRLVSRSITDVSTASRTALMNIATCKWDPDLCDLFGVPIECLPQIVSNTGEFGGVETEARSTPLTALIVDQQAALYGAGCRTAGDAKVTFGTGAFALMVTGPNIHHEQGRGLLPTVAWCIEGQDTVYALDGGVLTAAAAVNWARKLGLFRDLSELNTFKNTPAIDRGLVFVPALSGLGSPHWDRTARGTWLGLGLDDGPQDLMQALLEGVALRAAEVLQAMTGTIPSANAIAVDGGLSNNPYFLQFFSDVAARNLKIAEEPEVTAFGTASLAGKAIDAPEPEPAAAMKIHPLRSENSRIEKFRQAVSLIRDWGR